VLAEVALGCDRMEEAQAVLVRARAYAERGGELFMLPEVLRLSARVASCRSAHARARQLLEEAMALSRQQGAHWLGLRTATDLAHNHEHVGEPQAACVLLDDALARVDEGDDCADTIEARALRERLGSR
jgi:hypothetical protein